MNQKLHVLFLCGWYPSRVLSNNGDFIQRHAEAVSLQHKVTVFHIISDKNSAKNVEIVHEQRNGVNTYIAYIKFTKNPVFKLFLFITAFQTLMEKESSFDLIHLNEIFPFGVFCLFLKTPFVITEHSTGYLKEHHHTFSYVKKRVLKRIVKKSMRLCPVSLNLKNNIDELIEYKSPYSIVPNVVDTDVFIPKEHQSEIFTILHISNMNDDHKNISGLLETIAKFKRENYKFKLILLGDNSKAYISKAKELKIEGSINFIEHIAHEGVVKYLQEADVFLLFSNFENLPCVILESFACGTPVISTDVGGIREFFPEHFGKLIPKNDQQELLTSLEEFYIKEFPRAQKNEMHDYAVHKFGKEAIANQFSNVYFQVIEDSKNRKVTQ